MRDYFGLYFLSKEKKDVMLVGPIAYLKLTLKQNASCFGLPEFTLFLFFVNIDLF